MGRSPGSALGPYVLQERVGGGRASELWRAEGPAAPVAVRFFLGGREVPPLRVGIEALRALHHPHIAKVGELHRNASEPYLLREWVDGRSLEGATLRRAQAAQVLEALAYAHGRGIVHGRLSASNVLGGADGAVKLSDFGMAGSEAEPQADLRALGALLPPGDPWGARLRAGEFATAEEALAARPAEAPRGMPSWIAGPLLIVGVFFIAYVAAGVTFIGLQPSLRLIAAAAGASLCALAWRYVERPLPAAVFWGALLWGLGARGLGPIAWGGAAAVALAAGALWWRKAKKP